MANPQPFIKPDVGVPPKPGLPGQAGVLHVLRHVESRLVALRFRLDAENGDRARVTQEIPDPCFVRNDVCFPVVHTHAVCKLCAPSGLRFRKV